VVASIIVNLKFFTLAILSNPIQFNHLRNWQKSCQNNERRKGFSLATWWAKKRGVDEVESSEKLRSKQNDCRACWQRNVAESCEKHSHFSPEISTTLADHAILYRASYII